MPHVFPGDWMGEKPSHTDSHVDSSLHMNCILFCFHNFSRISKSSVYPFHIPFSDHELQYLPPVGMRLNFPTLEVCCFCKVYTLELCKALLLRDFTAK
jgi:hypothetical protein